MIIDCNGCRMQATPACDDCVVTFLVDGRGLAVEFDVEEIDAVSMLSAAGLLAPLRLQPGDASEEAATG